MTSRFCCTICVSASRLRTVSTAPPGMFMAVARVGGSPMARIWYGAVSDLPSTTIGLVGVSWVNADDSPIRAGPTEIASAPAPRNSSIASSMSSAVTWWYGSVMVISIPGPSAASVPARMPRSAARRRASCSAAWELSPPADSRSRVFSSAAICWRSRSSRLDRSSRIRTRSSCRRPTSPLPVLLCNWITSPNPSSASSNPISSPAGDAPQNRADSNALRPPGAPSASAPSVTGVPAPAGPAPAPSTAAPSVVSFSAATGPAATGPAPTCAAASRPAPSAAAGLSAGLSARVREPSACSAPRPARSRGALSGSVPAPAPRSSPFPTAFRGASSGSLPLRPSSTVGSSSPPSPVSTTSSVATSSVATSSVATSSVATSSVATSSVATSSVATSSVATSLLASSGLPSDGASCSALVPALSSARPFSTASTAGRGCSAGSGAAPAAVACRAPTAFGSALRPSLCSSQVSTSSGDGASFGRVGVAARAETFARPGTSCWSVVSLIVPPSRAEHMSPDSRRITEDTDAEDHDHAGGQLRTDTELVAQEDDQPSHQDVRDERDDEHLRVENAVQSGPDAPEHRVQGGHHGDRQVGLQPQRYGRLQHQAEDDADDQRDAGDQLPPPGVGVLFAVPLGEGVAVAAPPPDGALDGVPLGVPDGPAGADGSGTVLACRRSVPAAARRVSWSRRRTSNWIW